MLYLSFVVCPEIPFTKTLCVVFDLLYLPDFIQLNNAFYLWKWLSLEISLAKYFAMETQKILSADLLDILFDGRNKAYGAYALRKDYNQRMTVALGSMIAVVFILVAATFLSGSERSKQPELPFIVDPTLTKLVDPVIAPPPLVSKASEPPQVKTEKLTAFDIQKDKFVSPEDIAPPIEAFESARIGPAKKEGIEDNGLVPPQRENKSVTEVIAPVIKQQDYDGIFITAEYPAEFPGGQSEWLRYLQKNLLYPEEAIEVGVQGMVRVQFIVDKEGNISDVKALNDPGEGLAEEAVHIIKRGPKWKPAEQNGRKVIYRHIQTITFTLN